MIPRCTVGKGITGAARYILGEGRDPKTGQLRRKPANAESRVAWIGGIASEDELRATISLLKAALARVITL